MEHTSGLSISKEAEAQRDDEHWTFASAWGTEGGEGPTSASEPLTFTRNVEPLEILSGSHGNEELQVKLTLEVWRQPSTNAQGTWERHELDGLEPAMSILEMLDALNEQLIAQGKEQVAFESDCREGICGACGLTVNGLPHGPENNLPACHQRLRHFKDGDTVRIEPLRSASLPGGARSDCGSFRPGPGCHCWRNRCCERRNCPRCRHAVDQP